MAVKNIKKALSILYDMEKNDYMMAYMIQELNESIDCLGIREDIEEPVYESSVEYNVATSIAGPTIFGVFIGALLGMMSGCARRPEVSTGLLDAVGNTFNSIENMIGGVFWGAIIGGVAGLLIGFLYSFYAKKKAAEEDYYNYEFQRKKYEVELKKDNERVQQEMRQRGFLIRQRDALIKRRSEAGSMLIQFYNAAGIDRKYRNIVPIGYMYEYARLGISNHLDGVDGLYNLTENALRQDQFYLKMEEISQKLSTIIDNQHAIYEELRNLNRTCNRIVQSVESLSGQIGDLRKEVADHNRISEYNQERMLNELEYQRIMGITSHI
ncbi:MAG: hypothetical protein IJD01_02585 [Clostridia bacterium]|nr:hypothetical protein [Clostridia bacterium]